jgi:hypothetical protein
MNKRKESIREMWYISPDAFVGFKEEVASELGLE